MSKKIIFFILVILAVIFIIVEYKDSILGNNISVSDNIDILNISSYEALAEIEVYSNKNTNKYLINQKYLKPDIFKQEVLEPKNISGMIITCEGKKVTLQNQLLDLKTIYEDFNGEVSNFSLIEFANSYKSGIENLVDQNEEEIIMRTKINGNTNKYQMYQNLYISKNTNLPTKMEILDINKNVTVYILYKEIKINKLEKNDVL